MAGISDVGMPTPRQQLAAIAYVRGRLFMNAFRRKGGKGELIAMILLLPLFSLLALAPILGAGFLSYIFLSPAHTDKLGYYPWVLGAVFLIWMSLAISTKAVAPSFDLGMLIRFPIRFSTYLLIRLWFGLLDTPTVVCSLTLLASAIGIGVARPALFLPAAGVLLLLDVTILFFFRMIFLWFDRFFAQRKTREILVGLFFVAMLAFQYVNVTVNGGSNKHSTPAERAKHAQRIAFARKMLQTAEPVLHAAPPGLAATAIVNIATGKTDKVVQPIVGLVFWGAIFLRLFARRLKGEFHGESFSETTARPDEPVASEASAGPAPVLDVPVAAAAGGGVFSTTIGAVIVKELRYLVRSGPLLLALISPIFMVFILVARSGIGRHPGDWLLPSTLAYIMLGLTASMYNILGTDGPGIHLYLLAPIRLRDVVLAKNIVGVTLVLMELAIASAIVLSTTAVPTLPVLVATYLWLVFALMMNLTMGNIRSIYAPSLIDLGKFRQGKQGQLNALIGIGVLLVALGLGAGVLFLGNHVHLVWLPAGVFGVLGGLAIGFYVLNLNHLEGIALERREVITAELCKT